MKILLIAGMAESLVNFRGPLIADLQNRGLDVHVAAPDLFKGSSIYNQLQALGLTVHKFPMMRNGTNTLVDMWTVYFLWRLIRTIRPSVTLAYTIKPVIYGLCAAWLAGVPRRFALITGLGYVFEEDRSKAPLLYIVQKLYKFALCRASLVFFQNPDDLILFKARDILSKGVPTCVVNGSGVDLVRFSFKKLNLSISASSIHFLFMGRFLSDKGIREYVHAARLIRRSHPNVKFMLVGWIDSNPNSISQDELDEWVADGSIELLGKMSDVRSAIESCSVYVLPSYREGTPRSVLEAMAMGRPIITTDAPGCRETVIEGENGFLVQVKDVDALVIAMSKFIMNPSLITTMGRRSREMAEEKYDVHKVNAIMLHEMGIV
ncbi:MAG: glycosyltransferase family 1 protein [Polynucleobacter sp. 39-45-136]|nr:MAG: glycosyltransferase family 1 protein [Polynucleobacter sp. 39-45-136]